MNRGICVLRIIIFREGFEEEKKLVAQCLEKDICVQGRDLRELFKRLSATIYLEVPHMKDMPSTPDKFFEMWEKGKVLAHQGFLEAPIEVRQLVV